MTSTGFIMLRHVNSADTNRYWMHCYDCIRKYYPEHPIVIIDDNSNPEFITPKEMTQVTIVNSEYPQRGELLPYYYYSRNKWFDTAVIIHDSVFINTPIDFTVEHYKILWSFEHNWDQPADEHRILQVFNDPELLQFHRNKTLWKGCFGGMSAITHDYLSYINTKYDLSKLLDVIRNRYNRMSFERVLACLLQKGIRRDVLFGDIFVYVKNKQFPFDKKDDPLYNDLPLIKVWTGR